MHFTIGATGAVTGGHIDTEGAPALGMCMEPVMLHFMFPPSANGCDSDRVWFWMKKALLATGPRLARGRRSHRTDAPPLAPFAEVPPVLDGKLSDPAWSKAESTSAFLQKFPKEGEDPSERTTLRIVYDDANVYVAFDCEQRSVPIVQRLTRRGRLVESDWVSVAMGTRADGKSAFEFLVNASGVASTRCAQRHREDGRPRRE
jgi:hypothetical protein